MSGIVRANNAGQSGAVSNIETIDSDDYVDGSIDNAHIADDAIDSEHYAAGSIDNAHLADDAVDSDELAAGAVDTAHIGANQVTAAKIFDLARGSVLVGNASAATAELTIGSNTYVLASDGTDIAWTAAAGGGAVSLIGSNASEATTTATSVADLLVVDSLSVGTTTPIDWWGAVRKTTGAATGAYAGSKLNATVRGSGSASVNTWSATDNAIDNGAYQFYEFVRITNYVYGGLSRAASSRTGDHFLQIIAGAAPIATITSVTFTGFVGNASVTMGADEMYVYDKAIS